MSLPQQPPYLKPRKEKIPPPPPQKKGIVLASCLQGDHLIHRYIANKYYPLPALFAGPSCISCH